MWADMVMRIVQLGAVAAAALAGVALAVPPRVLNGQWSGEYTCSQGITGMTVELRPRRGDAVDATVTFFAHPANPAVESGCYAATGVVDRASGRLVLRPTAWILRPNPGWRMTSLDGRIDAAGSYDGRIVFAENPAACRTFTLRRGARPFKPAPAQCVTQAPMS